MGKFIKIEFDPPKEFSSDEIDSVLKDTKGNFDLTKGICIENPTPKKEELDLEKASKREQRKEWAKSGNSNFAAAAAATGTNSNDSIGAKANFLKVTLSETINLWKYSISLGSFKGRQPTSKNGKRAFVEYMLSAAKKNHSFKSDAFATDYHSTIISVGELFEGESLRIEHQPYPNADKYVTSTIQSLEKIDFTNLKNLVGKKAMSANGKKVAGSVYLPDDDIRALNIVSWKKINDSGWKGGRVGNKFYPNDLWEQELAENVRQLSLPNAKVKRNMNVGPYWLATGFFTSIRPGESSILLNVNVTTSAFYAKVTVQEWIKLRGGSGNELLGRKVQFSCDKKDKQRVIRKIDYQDIRDKSFALDGKVFSVVKHLEKEYSLKINSSHKVYSVNCGPPDEKDKKGREEWYPASALNIVPWQHVQGKIDTKYDEHMVQVANRTPDKVQKLIEQHALKDLDLQADDGIADYAKFGLEINTKLMDISPRKIAPPTVLYSPPDNSSASKTSTQWNLKNVNGFSKVNAEKLKALYFIQVGDRRDDHLKTFRKLLVEILPAYGFPADLRYFKKAAKSPPQKIPGVGVPPAARRKFVEVAMKEAYDGLKELHQAEMKNEETRSMKEKATREGTEFNPKKLEFERVGEASLLFIILPENDETMYSDVKWWGDCVRGIPTMCITHKTISKALGFTLTFDGKGKVDGYYDDGTPDRMVVANLCLKINFKLGGRNHEIQGGLGLKANTMVVGADVTHYTTPDSGCPSLAGVVACAANSSNDYLASARLQPNKTEFIEQLQGMMEERLRVYQKMNNKTLPNHILFYRDGVGDSQYGMVHDHELPQIEEAVRRVAGSNAIRITLLVVGKRHHARFFRMPNDQVKHTNFDGGICVNSDVVAPRHFNFYLQSHKSPLSTARNAHYVVIKNESAYSARELQDVTNKLCYVGSRATCTQSTCIPVKYADLLCNRLRCYMRPVQEGATISHIKNGEIKDYATQKIIWLSKSLKQGVAKKRRNPEEDWEYNASNPWRDDENTSLGKTMFYL